MKIIHLASSVKRNKNRSSGLDCGEARLSAVAHRSALQKIRRTPSALRVRLQLATSSRSSKVSTAKGADKKLGYYVDEACLGFSRLGDYDACKQLPSLTRREVINSCILGDIAGLRRDSPMAHDSVATSEVS